MLQQLFPPPPPLPLPPELSPPPAPPAVTFTLLIRGTDLNEVERSTIATKVAALANVSVEVVGVVVGNITLTTNGASIDFPAISPEVLASSSILTVVVTVPDMASPTAIYDALVAALPSAEVASIALGVTALTDPVIQAPPSPPPPPPTSPPPPSTEARDKPIVIFITTTVCLGVLVLCALAYLVLLPQPASMVSTSYQTGMPKPRV